MSILVFRSYVKRMCWAVPALRGPGSCSKDDMNKQCSVLQGLAGHLSSLELQSVPSIIPELQGPAAAVAGAHPRQSDLHGEFSIADLPLEGILCSAMFPFMSGRWAIDCRIVPSQHMLELARGGMKAPQTCA